MGSSRLPGKVLLRIAGRPMLSYQLERLRDARRAARLVVAMSVELTDDAIAALCAREGATCMRGLERRVPPKSIAVRGAR